MKTSKKFIRGSTRACLKIILLTAMAAMASSQTLPDFSGTWKQDNDRCLPKRSGDVTLHIEQHSPELTVETSISRASLSSEHAVQKYTTDGNISTSTGPDGDEFHTSIVWRNSSLVFTIEEHEDGRTLHSQETWSLIENGATLQRTRRRTDGNTQVLVYLRQ